MDGFNDKINMLYGVERRFNKAINSLSLGLNDYRRMVEIIVSSTDRLINKSNVVLEEIN